MAALARQSSRSAPLGAQPTLPGGRPHRDSHAAAAAGLEAFRWSPNASTVMPQTLVPCYAGHAPAPSSGCRARPPPSTVPAHPTRRSGSARAVRGFGPLGFKATASSSLRIGCQSLPRLPAATQFEPASGRLTHFPADTTAATTSLQGGRDMTRIALVLATTTLTASLAEAQNTSFDRLALLVDPGDAITVTDKDGRRLKGRLLDLSSTTLALQAGGLRHELDGGDISLVRRRERDSLKNGTLNGAVTGLGAAAVPLLILVSHPDVFGGRRGSSVDPR